MTALAGRRSDFADLSRLIQAAGLLHHRLAYSIARIALITLLYAAGWVAFVVLGDSWWQLLTAVYLGAVFTQFGFLGHDAGHKQIFRTRRPSSVLGLLYGNLGIGMSYGWWIDKHNRHHAHPNTIGSDPDIEPGVVVFAAGHADRRVGLAGLWTRAQAYLFVPLLLGEAIALRVASVKWLLTGSGRAVRTERALLFVHLVAYVTTVFLVLSPLHALIFIAVHQGVFGVYMGCAFAPNHKGMLILDPDDDLDYLRRQVLTSRNIRGGPVADFLLGGLNYQIEHHLFPSMPRANLRLAQPVVRAFCHERGVSYCEVGLLESYRQAIGHLHTVGTRAGAAP